MKALSYLSAFLFLSLAACGGDSGTDDSGTHDMGMGTDLGTDTGTVDMGTDTGTVDMGGDDMGGPTNQCTNTADGTIIMNGVPDGDGGMVDPADVAGACGRMSLGSEPGTMNCIVSGTGLSAGCAGCYDATVHCALDHCLTMCIAGSSPACDMCLATNCTPAFFTCSGLPMPDGGMPDASVADAATAP